MEINLIFLFTVVPAVILFLISHPDSITTDFSSLEFVVYGASPIAESTIVKAREIMKCDLYQVYGLTETTGAITMMMPDDHGSSIMMVDRPAHPDCEA